MALIVLDDFRCGMGGNPAQTSAALKISEIPGFSHEVMLVFGPELTQAVYDHFGEILGKTEPKIVVPESPQQAQQEAAQHDRLRRTTRPAHMEGS